VLSRLICCDYAADGIHAVCRIDRERGMVCFLGAPDERSMADFLDPSRGGQVVRCAKNSRSAAAIVSGFP
jgi:hypothetical protein